MAFAVVDTAGVLTLVPTASDKRTATLDYVDVFLVGRHHNQRRLPLAVPCYCSIDCGQRIEAILARYNHCRGRSTFRTRCVMMGHRCRYAAGTGACVAMRRSVRVVGMRMWLGGSRSGRSSTGGLAKYGCAARTDSTVVCAGEEGRARLRQFLRCRSRWGAAGPTRLRHADGSTRASALHHVKARTTHFHAQAHFSRVSFTTTMTADSQKAEVGDDDGMFNFDDDLDDEDGGTDGVRRGTLRCDTLR